MGSYIFKKLYNISVLLLFQQNCTDLSDTRGEVEHYTDTPPGTAIKSR